MRVPSRVKTWRLYWLLRRLRHRQGTYCDRCAHRIARRYHRRQQVKEKA